MLMPLLCCRLKVSDYFWDVGDRTLTTDYGYHSDILASPTSLFCHQHISYPTLISVLEDSKFELQIVRVFRLDSFELLGLRSEIDQKAYGLNIG